MISFLILKLNYREKLNLLQSNETIKLSLYDGLRNNNEHILIYLLYYEYINSKCLIIKEQNQK
jgi:hypothetical protein